MRLKADLEASLIYCLRKRRKDEKKNKNKTGYRYRKRQIRHVRGGGNPEGTIEQSLRWEGLGRSACELGYLFYFRFIYFILKDSCLLQLEAVRNRLQ